jgi:transposase-like protein
MTDLSLFKWRYFEADIILCAVRSYLRYAQSYRDVEELLREQGGNSSLSLAKEDNHGHHTAFTRGPLPALPL